MNDTISIYSLETGLFTGHAVSGPVEFLPSQIPDGMGGKLGRYDHLSQKVDLETGEVVDYQPSAPESDGLLEWTWDAQSKRWASAPTAAGLWAMVRAERNRLLRESDWMVARAFEGGPPVPPAWAAYRQALRDLTSQPDPLNLEWPEPPPN